MEGSKVIVVQVEDEWRQVSLLYCSRGRIKFVLQHKLVWARWIVLQQGELVWRLVFLMLVKYGANK